MAIKYKQKCFRCRKNYVATTWKERFPVCYECSKKELEGKIKDPAMKKFFNIPEQFYMENAFLRDIKIKYLKFGNLTEKQVDAFKKVVKQLKQEKKK